MGWDEYGDGLVRSSGGENPRIFGVCAPPRRYSRLGNERAFLIYVIIIG